jgi:hypothetical protein
MLETKDLYKDYITNLEIKIATVSNKITQYYGSKEYLKNAIINNKSEFENVGINVDNLFENPYIAYIKIKQLVENGQLTRVAHYVKSYVNAIRYTTLHELLYERLNKAIMPYEVYLKMLGYSNQEIAKYILKGGYYTFGNAGKLYIREKARTFLFKGVPVKLPVDWGNSNKYKKQLIEEGKTPFNTANAPDGVKWHTHHNSDYGYWFWWEAGAIENRGFFKFIPSKFTRRGSKKDIVFNNKDEILNTTEIGILNKMLELMKIDSIHFLNYRRPEKEIKKEIHQKEFVNN